MGEPAPLTGPDLQSGVPADSVADGAIVRGHAFGEPVALVRRGQEFLAVQANCTHYNGPLDEGLQVGDSVRCPWHHACFDLRTGEALRAPALRPLQRYTTSVASGVVRVTGKMEAAPPKPRREGPGPVVIVGNGAAAAAAVEKLRSEGFDGRITMIGREPNVPVDRPNLSKDYLAGTAPEEWIPLRDEAFYADLGVELRMGVEVTRLEPDAKRVVLADGSAVDYGACLLATGSDPIRLPIPGAERAHTLRTLADSRAIIGALGGAKRVVVIGASFIGLEVAASMRARGLEVHVVAPEATPLEKVMGAQVGAFLREVHEGKGVVFHLQRTVMAIGDGDVTLSDGSRMPADLVVMGVGVRPNVALAEKAGLTVDRGIVVDATLRTSAPGVWAAGDIARWPDPHTGELQRIEHWVLAERMGQAAARNILGANEPFDAVPFFWSVHHDVFINWIGFPGGEDIEIMGSLADRSAAVAYRKNGKTRAVATIFMDHLNLEAERLLEQDDHAALRALVSA